MKTLSSLLFLSLIFLSACSEQNAKLDAKVASKPNSKTEKNIKDVFKSYAEECSIQFEKTTSNVQIMQPKNGSDFIFPESLREAFYNDAKNCLAKIEKYIAIAVQKPTCAKVLEGNKTVIDETMSPNH